MRKLIGSTGGNERPGLPIRRPPLHRRPLVSRLKFYTQNDMRKKSSSKRPSKPMTNGTSNEPTLQLLLMVPFLHTFWIERVKRMPKPFHLPSNRSGRIRLLNMRCRYPRFVGSLKRRCSRSCGLGKAKRRLGNEW